MASPVEGATLVSRALCRIAVVNGHVKNATRAATELLMSEPHACVEHEHAYPDPRMATQVCTDAVQTPSHGLDANLIGDLEHLKVRLDIPHDITSGDKDGLKVLLSRSHLEEGHTAIGMTNEVAGVPAGLAHEFH